MIGSQDTWVQMPTVDLYDTQMMLAAVNAARDMYNRNEQRIKEFNEKYGDFTTPIIADQDWYNREMLGKVYGTINDIYAQGGDPLRNSQDRLRISMMLNSLPYGEYARKKLRSENAKEWFKNMAILNAKGKYDKDFSDFLGENPNQWALNDPGTTSPTEFSTLKEATNDWYNNRTPRSATAEEKQRLGLDPNYDYTLFTDTDLMNIARDQTPGWNNSAISKYYRNLAEKQVASRGIPYTQEDVERQLQRNIASAQQEWKVDPIRGKADEFALDDYRTNNDIRAAGAKEAIQHKYWELQHGYDLDGDGVVTKSERKTVTATINNKSKDEESSYLQDQFDKGVHAYVTGEAGYNLTSKQLEDDSKNFASRAFADTKQLRYATSKEAWQKEKNKYLANKTKRGILDPTALTSYREPVKDMTDAVYIRPGDINKLSNSDELVSRTFGGARRGKERFNTDRTVLKNIGSDNIKMQFTDETYTAPLRYNSGVRAEQRQRVRLYHDIDDPSDATGKTKKTVEIPGDWWFLVQSGDYHRGTYEQKGSDVITYAPSGISNTWSDDIMGEIEPYDRAVNKTVGRKPIKNYE